MYIQDFLHLIFLKQMFLIESVGVPVFIQNVDLARKNAWK